jgi:hypothetical protein
METIAAFLLGCAAGAAFGVWANERMMRATFEQAVQRYEEQIDLLSAVTDDTEQVYQAKARLN